MGIRETMNRHSGLTTAAVVCLLAGGVVAIGMELRGDDGRPPEKNFFTVDDGKTWFADSATKQPPFDHDGSKAVRCYVFTGKNGKFVGLLEKYSDSTLQQLARDSKPPTSIPVMVKRPGEREWKNIASDQEAMMLMNVFGPDGSETELALP